MTEFPDEDVLPDDYPIYGDYLYVVDGKLYLSDWHDVTVRQLKRHLKATEIRRCNMCARQEDLKRRRSTALPSTDGNQP